MKQEDWFVFQPVEELDEDDYDIDKEFEDWVGYEPFDERDLDN